jgi:hypothetical protein
VSENEAGVLPIAGLNWRPAGRQSRLAQLKAK